MWIWEAAVLGACVQCYDDIMDAKFWEICWRYFRCVMELVHPWMRLFVTFGVDHITFIYSFSCLTTGCVISVLKGLSSSYWLGSLGHWTSVLRSLTCHTSPLSVRFLLLRNHITSFCSKSITTHSVMPVTSWTFCLTCSHLLQAQILLHDPLMGRILCGRYHKTIHWPKYAHGVVPPWLQDAH